MKLNLLVRIYAEAFWDYARESLREEEIVGEAEVLGEVIKDNPEFSRLLSGPELSLSDKFSFIDEVLGSKFSPQIRNLLQLAAEKGRIHLLGEVLDFISNNYGGEKKKQVLIQSAYPLGEIQRQGIEGKLKEKLKEELSFIYRQDKDLIGGVRVVVGDIVIDGSIRGRLEELKYQLA